MEIGINSFVALSPAADGGTPSAKARVADLLDEVVLAEQVGIDVFGIGEHHRPDFADSSPAVLLAAAAARTNGIRLTSAVSVLSTVDPVRLFQDFATLDIISGGRAEIVVGRGSFAEAYPLFGYQRGDYDALFAEKLGLLTKLNEETHVQWAGNFRPALTGQGVYPRPAQDHIPIWLGVGGTPQSFERAGSLGLPLMIAIIGSDYHRFRPLVDLYRRAGAAAGFGADRIKVGVHVTGFLADDDEGAKAAFFPGWQAAFTRIGKERGFAPVSRDQFEASCASDGPFLVGAPKTVVAKIRYLSKVVGDISRVSFQMSAANCGQDIVARSIELIGTAVRPALQRTAAHSRVNP